MAGVDVEYHPETYDRFFAPLDVTHPGFTDTLKTDFALYQQSVLLDEPHPYLPDYFGCDEVYGSPPSIAGCIEHIHLCIPPRTFNKNAKQKFRKCRRGDPENDVALVYSRGLIDDSVFAIIGILMPDAHARARDMALMEYLGRLGRSFRRNN